MDADLGDGFGVVQANEVFFEVTVDLILSEGEKPLAATFADLSPQIEKLLETNFGLLHAQIARRDCVAAIKARLMFEGCHQAAGETDEHDHGYYDRHG